MVGCGWDYFKILLACTWIFLQLEAEKKIKSPVHSLFFLPLINIFLLVDQQGKNLARTLILYPDICSLSCSGIYRPSRTERSAATPSPAKRKTTSVGERSSNSSRFLVKLTCLRFLLKSSTVSPNIMQTSRCSGSSSTQSRGEAESEATPPVAAVASAAPPPNGHGSLTAVPPTASVM